MQSKDYFLEATGGIPSIPWPTCIWVTWPPKPEGMRRQLATIGKSIRRITSDYTRPRDCEALYRLGVVLKKQKKYEAAMDTLVPGHLGPGLVCCCLF